MNKIYIKEFHPDLISPNSKNYLKTEQGGSKIIIIGKPGSGKSTLIKYLLLAKQDIFPIAMAMNGSELNNNFYSTIIHPLFVYKNYNEEKLEKLKKRQDESMKSIYNPWCFLVLDDCTSDKKIFNSNIQRDLFKNGRHWKCLYIIGLQYCIDIPSDVRSCIDGVFIFRQINETDLMKIWKNFAGAVPTFPIFRELMNEITKDYTALYIDNQTNVENWWESIYFVKAPELSNYKKRIGCIEYKGYSEHRCDKKYYDDPLKEVKLLRKKIKLEIENESL